MNGVYIFFLYLLMNKEYGKFKKLIAIRWLCTTQPILRAHASGCI